MYSPTLGRFMQTDLIGYAYGMNWYDYVGSDPVNYTDPTGLAPIVVNGKKITCPIGAISGSGGRLAVGAYGAVGKRYSGALSTPQLGCW